MHPDYFRLDAHIFAELLYRKGEVVGFFDLTFDFVHHAVARSFAFARTQLQVFVVKDDSIHNDDGLMIETKV
jgi:hypothetical protein